MQAKYTLDLLFDNAQSGVAKTFLYELLDAYAPGSRQGDDGFGLFDYTGAPKLAATALHNVTTLLQDAGTGPVSSTVPAFTLSGLPATARTMTIQKTDGSTWVALWAEPQIWDMNAGTEIAAPSSTVTLTTGATHTALAVFDPLVGTTAIAAASDALSISATLTDHPILIRLSATTVVARVAPLIPVAMTYAAYLAAAEMPVLAGGAPVTVTGVSVADRPAVARDGRVAALTVSDTAAALGQGTLAALGSDSKVQSIAVADARPVALGYGDYVAGNAGVAKLAGDATFVLTATAATLANATTLAALGGDSRVAAIRIDGGTTLTLSRSAYAANAAALAKLAGPYGLTITGVSADTLASVERDAHVKSVALADTTTHLAAMLPALAGDKTVQSIVATDAAPFRLTAAGYLAGKGALNKMASYTAVVTNVSVAALAGIEANGRVVSVSVADTAARLGGTRLVALGADAKVGSVTVTDRQAIVVNALGTAAGRAGLAKLAGTTTLAVRGSSGSLSGGALDVLQPRAGHVASISFTDAIKPTLTLSQPQLLADAALLSKVATPFTLSVTGVDRGVPSAVKAIAATAPKLQVLELTHSDGSRRVELIGSNLVHAASRNDEVVASGRNEAVVFRAAGFGAASLSGIDAGDHIVFGRSVFSGFQDVKAHAAGSRDAVITDRRGDTLTLKGVASSALTSSMFMFV